MNKEDIPLLSEINIKDIERDKYYTVYPTQGHKDNDKTWWFTGRDIIGYKIASIRMKENTDNYLMWGKESTSE